MQPLLQYRLMLKSMQMGFRIWLIKENKENSVGAHTKTLSSHVLALLAVYNVSLYLKSRIFLPTRKNTVNTGKNK